MAELDDLEAMLDAPLAENTSTGPEKVVDGGSGDAESAKGAGDDAEANVNGERSEKDKDKHSRKSRDKRSRSRDRDRDKDRKDRDRKDKDRGRDRDKDRDKDRRSRRSRHSRSPRRRSRSPRRSSRRSSPSRRTSRRSRSPRRQERRERTPPREKSPVLSEMERDARTIVCMQLSQQCRAPDLGQFLQEKAGPVRSCKIITDRVSGRSKGIAYVEFYDLDSIPKAIGLNGEALMGVPIMVMLTESEKNRLAAAKAQEEKLSLCRVAVGNLPPQLDTDMLKMLFESFGRIKECIVTPGPPGQSSSGYVEFDSAKDASTALEAMNGHTVLDRAISVSLASQLLGGMMMQTSMLDIPQASNPLLDQEETDRTGIMMTSAGRANIMAKLAASHGATGMTNTMMTTAIASTTSMPNIPNIPVIQPIQAGQGQGQGQAGAEVAGVVTQPGVHLALRNMFNPATETEPEWDLDLREDVLEECSKFGPIVHVFVDKNTQGTVYLKFHELAGAVAAQGKMAGRYFGGAQLGADFVSSEFYEQVCPDSVNATTVLVVEE